MRISVFGLGYVGCVSSACLASDGNEVIGVDINPLKVELINKGRSPVIEQGIDEIIKDTVRKRKFKATTCTFEGIKNSDVSLVCVGTPSNDNGSLNLEHIRSVIKSIGEALINKEEYHVIVIRSTVLPASTEEIIIPILQESSGKKVGVDFGICVNPEFLREGTSVFDFYNPPMTLIGEYDERSGDVVKKLYLNVEAPLVRTDIKSAEISKYVNNAFHALKVSFANEIGNICKKVGIDSHKVMEIFCMDTKLNLSPYYLKPGFAFGGSCLPKDLRALIYKGKQEDLNLPLLNSILLSNENQIKIGLDLIKKTKRKKIGILGLSFKAGTDDLRESPMVLLVEQLIGKGYNVKIYDNNVSIAKIFGANKQYIEKEIPHISSLICSEIRELIANCEVIVIGNNENRFKKALKNIKDGQIVIDLVRVFEDKEKFNRNYVGICW